MISDHIEKAELTTLDLRAVDQTGQRGDDPANQVVEEPDTGHLCRR